jgi:hypothetical protein
LLQRAVLAQKLFDACMLQAHLLMRERRSPEADQQLATCARDYQLDAPARANSVAVHGPPELQAAFDKTRAKLTTEASGRLTVESSPKGCNVFINGLAAGETPLRASQVRGENARVQLVCRNKPGRIHRVTVGRGEQPVQPVQIDVRFDAALSTQDALQLRYADASDRDAHMESDGRTLLRALGVDRVALLVGHQQGQAWQFELTILDGNRPGAHNLGTIGFSEAAGYEPERLRELTALLPEAGEHRESASSNETAPVALTPRATATASVVNPTPEQLDSPRLLPTVGLAIGAVGLIGVAGSWALFAERRSFRLRNRDEVSVADEAAYARRGTWTVLAGGLGASLLTVSPYFWLPDAPGLRPVAWVVGGVGLAVAAVGVVTTLSDEHCGPERGGELREPCRSVRADALFGVELALTAVPFAALPLTLLLRDLLGTESVSVSAALQRDGILVQAGLTRL